MKNYKKWSAQFRGESLKLTNKAKKMGWIKDPKVCHICKQDKGIIHLHNEDYDVTFYTLQKAFNRFPISITETELAGIKSVLTPLCWRCHMMHHSKKRNPQSVEDYFIEVLNGKQYPPVFFHNFDILKTDHNV